MNGMSDELFASAGFTVNQNGGAGGRDTLHLFKHGFESRAVPDNLLECAFGSVPISVCNCFATLQEDPRNDAARFPVPPVACSPIECGANSVK